MRQHFVWYVYFVVLCLIVVTLPLDKTPFAVLIIIIIIIIIKLRGLISRANYTDRATAACR
jgi:hypothetical protein